MSKRAIDIVLLPPKEITDLAIKLNKPLVNGSYDEIALDAQTCLPHLSLLMGVMDDERLPEIRAALDDIATVVSPLTLQAHFEVTNSISAAVPYSLFVVDYSPELRRCHALVRERVIPLISLEGAEMEMFFVPPVINEVPDYFTSGRSKTQLEPEHYNPHITVGLGAAEAVAPFSFSASTLALCHLGNRCTCRAVLAKTELKGSV